MAEEKTSKEEQSPAPKGNLSPLVIVLMFVNIAALGTIAYFQWKFMEMEAKKPSLTTLLKEMNDEKKAAENNDAENEAKPVEDIQKENLMALDSFTVNLAQGEGPRRYVRMDAVLKLSDNAQNAEFETRKPQIRDTIISILNTKRAEDLLKKEGKNYLKDEIKAAINSYLIDGRVDDIYYVSFQIN